MKSTLLFAARYAIVLLAAPPLVGAWADVDDRARQDSAAPDRDELHRRWAGFSEEERQHLRERFAALNELDPAERARLTERTRRLDELSRQLYRGMEEVHRRRLDGLPAHKRRELLHEMVLAEARETSRRLWNKLTAEDRERLEGAGERERLKFFTEFRRRQNQRIDRTIEDLGPGLGFSSADLERLRDLSPDRRRQQFLEIVKRRILRTVESFGLPRDFPVHRWPAVVRLSPEEFYLAVLRIRRSFPELGIQPRQEAPEAPETTEAHRRLAHSMHLDLDPAERLALSHLGRAERGVEIRRRKRARALAVIRESQLLPPAGIGRLQGLPDRQFFLAVRDLLPQRGGAGGERPAERAPGDRR